MDTVAVVLVPGIFASPLISDGNLGWPLNDRIRMRHQLLASPMEQRFEFQNQRTWLPRGVQSQGVDPLSLGWETVADEFYRPFLQDCSEQGDVLRFNPAVFACGYNWLRSNKASSGQLIRYVGTILERFSGNFSFRGILFVTHSMGALVVLETLRALEARRRAGPLAGNWIDRVLGVVHVAAPLVGAPEVIMRYVRGLEGSRLNQKDVLSMAVFGNAGWKCLASASAVRSGFDLMPFPSAIAGLPSVFRRSIVPAPADDPFYLQAIFRTATAPTFSYPVNVLEEGVTVSTDTRSQPIALKDRRERTAVIAGRDLVASDLARGVASGLEFHRRLNRYRFPHSGAVVLSGVPTVQQVALQFDSREIDNDARLVSVEATRSNQGDGTVPAASQHDRIPDLLATDTLGATPMTRTVKGIKHEDALAGKPDKAVFSEVYRLLNRLYDNAKRLQLGGIR